jgi:DNA-binding LacI/PurR family transcriptional regulator
MRPIRDSSPTIYDVASLSGLSIATVSRVLNSPERVNEATRSKVMAAIDQLGYVPKAEARARALQNQRRIGVLTPFFTAPSFVQRLRGIDSVLPHLNYELIIYTVESKTRLEGYLSTLPLTGSLDGLIIMSLPMSDEESRRLCESRLETVLIEYSQECFSSVEIDDFAGGKMAAQYLLEHGHRQVGFIGDINPPDYAIHPVVHRFEGFRSALNEAGIDLPENYICSAWHEQTTTRQAAQQLLNLPEPPTAIFAAADIQAIVTMRVARELGLHVPDDLAILGFDDLEIADYVGLTTVRQPLDDSGRIAAELLLGRLMDADRPVQHVHLPLSIVERETV